MPTPSRPATTKFPSSSSTSSAGSVVSSFTHSDCRPVATVEVLHCLRCHRQVEATSTDDLASTGMRNNRHTPDSSPSTPQLLIFTFAYGLLPLIVGHHAHDGTGLVTAQFAKQHSETSCRFDYDMQEDYDLQYSNPCLHAHSRAPVWLGHIPDTLFQLTGSITLSDDTRNERRSFRSP
ncbi:hypothetical protein GGS21DRAFT_485904 [Xylaria nigripes]|nr:hypothetical protein GGS21DRAFT_485904 [Xylaria nigripes]